MGEYTTYYYKESTGAWDALANYMVGAFNITGLPIFWSNNERVKGGEVVTLSNGKSGLVRPENTFFTDSADLGYLEYDEMIVVEDLVENSILLKFTDINSQSKVIVMTEMEKKEANVYADQMGYRVSVTFSEIDDPTT